MTRNPFIKRALASIAMFALAVSVLAVSLPIGTRLELRDDAGTLVGAGKVDDDGNGTLEFEILIVVGMEIVPLSQLAAESGLHFDFEVGEEEEDGDDD